MVRGGAPGRTEKAARHRGILGGELRWAAADHAEMLRGRLAASVHEAELPAAPPRPSTRKQALPE